MKLIEDLFDDIENPEGIEIPKVGDIICKYGKISSIDKRVCFIKPLNRGSSVPAEITDSNYDNFLKLIAFKNVNTFVFGWEKYNRIIINSKKFDGHNCTFWMEGKIEINISNKNLEIKNTIFKTNIIVLEGNGDAIFDNCKFLNTNESESFTIQTPNEDKLPVFKTCRADSRLALQIHHWEDAGEFEFLLDLCSLTAHKEKDDIIASKYVKGNRKWSPLDYIYKKNAPKIIDHVAIFGYHYDYPVWLHFMKRKYGKGRPIKGTEWAVKDSSYTSWNYL